MAREVLTPSLMALFLRMDPGEQAHSLAVFQKLKHGGETHDSLQAAALLHDVGKSRYPLRIWERVLIVLMKAFLPAALHSWGQGEPTGWRRPFVIAMQHPKWGAQMAAEAGAPPLVVSIIRRHQDNPVKFSDDAGEFSSKDFSLEDRLIYYLQYADNES